MRTVDIIPGTNYRIIQSESSFKYGIDSILLSSFCNMKKGSTLIDIGTGVGILALRCHALYSLGRVYAYEIQEELAILASESVSINGVDDEIFVINKNIMESELEEKVDYIITNPPYVEAGRGIENKSEAKLIAFHEVTLNLVDIFKYARDHLVQHGKLIMINRSNRLVDIMSIARLYKLEPVRMRSVHSKINSKSKLVMCEFVLGGGKNFTYESPLIIYDESGNYTEEIKEIYYGKR